jgi:membrane-bound serine protease (ClpP class)
MLGVARRWPARLMLGVAAVVLVGALIGPSPAAAQGQEIGPCPADIDEIPAADSVVRIVKVSGLIDPVVASFLLDELEAVEQRAASTDVVGLVIWLNSRGSVLDDAGYIELATALAESPVTTAVWVGQSGGVAIGGAAELLGVVDVVGVSSGSSIGETGRSRLPSSFPPAFGEATERLETSTIGADEAISLGVSVGPLQDVSAISSFVALLPGYELGQCLPADDTGEDAASSGTDAGDETAGGSRQPVSFALTSNELTGLSLSAQLFHTVASPEVAYLLFAMGLALLLFELYTAGIGVAGVIGAGFVALGCYGLAALPTRWWGIGLLVLSMLLLAVDVQTNVPRYYTAVGLVSFAAGTVLLYDGVGMSWVTVVVGIIGAILYAYAGMPSMVRTRFSTPTIGRQWMIGEMGEAITDIAPEGTVQVRDVAWRAVTNRATPVKAGGPIRVIGLDHLVLEIEPEEGGARDYRQRR